MCEGMRTQTFENIIKVSLYLLYVFIPSTLSSNGILLTFLIKALERSRPCQKML